MRGGLVVQKNYPNVSAQAAQQRLGERIMFRRWVVPFTKSIGLRTPEQDDLFTCLCAHAASPLCCVALCSGHGKLTNGIGIFPRVSARSRLLDLATL
jgi:hypothetical protein